MEIKEHLKSREAANAAGHTEGSVNQVPSGCSRLDEPAVVVVPLLKAEETARCSQKGSEAPSRLHCFFSKLCHLN